MLPYWCDAYPKLRLIHLVRNGLDMAYSRDTNQLQMFQDLVLSSKDLALPRPCRAMIFWSIVNLQANAIGKSRLGTAYHMLRFEDLCREPQVVIARLASFLGTPMDFTGALAQVKPPPSIGRWRGQTTAEVLSLLKLGRAALERLGYWDTALARMLAANELST